MEEVGEGMAVLKVHQPLHNEFLTPTALERLLLLASHCAHRTARLPVAPSWIVRDELEVCSFVILL